MKKVFSGSKNYLVQSAYVSMTKRFIALVPDVIVILNVPNPSFAAWHFNISSK
jgi:hypothetical protein